MAQAVIDRFEIVEINEYYRDPGIVTLGLQDGLLEAVIQQAAVGQARQRVMMGQKSDLVFGVFAFNGDAGDVGGEIDQPLFVGDRFAHCH